MTDWRDARQSDPRWDEADNTPTWWGVCLDPDQPGILIHALFVTKGAAEQYIQVMQFAQFSGLEDDWDWSRAHAVPCYISKLQVWNSYDEAPGYDYEV